MSISDPAQILQRVPELEALTDDPKISRAIETGDTFKVYRALVLARLLRRLPAHHDLLKKLTAERRLFIKPLKGTPSLMSFNSVGFGFVGKAEKNPDDSYIALHALVVLFYVPIIPLGAYVVRDDGSRKYQIFARAPLGILGWLYTRGVAAALVLSVGAGALHAYKASGNQDLTVLNGFEIPLTVDIGGQKVTVEPNGRSMLTLKVGKVTGTARTAKGEVLDTLSTDIKSSGRLSIWNVAGAAPLVRNTIVYSKTPSANDSSQQIYCGARFVELPDIRYAFEDPPTKVKLSRSSDSTTVQHVAVAKTANAAGAVACLSWAMNENHIKDVVPLAEAMAQLDGWHYRMAYLAAYAAENVSHAEAVRVAQRAAKAQPQDVLIARMLQGLRDRDGQHDALLREHAARAQAQPDSAIEQYLYASLLSGTPGIEAMQKLVETFPRNGPMLRSLAWRKYAHGDYAGALRDITRLHQVSPEDAYLITDVEVRALMAAHRGPAALALLEKNLADPAFTNRDDSTVDFALLATQLGADPERFLKAADRTGETAAESVRTIDALRTRAGLPLLQATSGADPKIKLALALRDAPAQAVKQLAGMERADLFSLSTGQRALLFGEAVHRGDSAASNKLGDVMHLSALEDAGLRKFVRGEAASLDALDLDPDLQAAVYFIRSRNKQLPEGERSALRERAAQLDVLHGPVSTALKQWPVES
jgi:hypothetical protein